MYVEREVSRKHAVPRERRWGSVEGECANMRNILRGGIVLGSTFAGRYGILANDDDEAISNVNFVLDLVSG